MTNKTNIGKKSKSDRTPSGKERSAERKLDKELEMTFPASDALAISQPHRTKNQ